MSKDGSPGAGVVKGDYVSDGKTFIFRLEGMPISGVGGTPQEAFDNMMRAKDQAGALGLSLVQLAEEQRYEAARSRILRLSLVALIVFGGVGGALVGAVALAPKVAGQLVEVSTARVDDWLSNMTPEQRNRIASIFGQSRDLVGASPSEGPAAGAPSKPAEPAGRP